jgi:di/tricarboxylate transporter
MTLDAWFTLFVVLLCFGLLSMTRYPADAIMMGGLSLLLLTGVLTPEQALSGLSNEGMVTVGVLYIVAAGLHGTGAVTWLVHSFLGRPKSLNSAQFRLMTPVAAFSAFLNNTPVVAIMIPAVKDWAKRNNMAVSKLMMPLSYAAIAGGTCTLIGTSTNLVVNGLLIEATGESGLGLFELAWIGVPVTVMVILSVMLGGRWLLPKQKAMAEQMADARGYTVEMMVDEGSTLVGKSIEKAGLRHLPGLYLIEIDRDGRILPAVSPQEELQGNDRLIFAGVVESVVDLQKIRGLTPATNQVFKLNSPRSERCLIEAVISDSNPMVGISIREGKFRSYYNAAVIAVARKGEHIQKRIGDIVLQQGDTLLLEAQPNFVDQQRNSRDFYLVSRLDDSTPPRHERAVTALLILAMMVFTVTLGWISILTGSLIAAGLMIISRCTTASEGRRSVDWSVLVVIAAAIGIGQALQISGAAAVIATQLLSLSGGEPMLALLLVFTATTLLTSIITNNAAAVLMFPIALTTSHDLGVSFMPFVITIMVSASLSFATPMGYQTNLMVMAPGGYRFSDYLKMGIPLTIIVGVIVMLLVPQIWPF